MSAAAEGDEKAFETTTEPEDQGPYRRVGPQERKVVMDLTSALKVSRLHALDNRVTQEAIGELASSLATFFERRDELTLIMGEGRLFVNGAALRVRRTGHSWMHDLLEFFQRMGVGGLILKGRWPAAALRQVLEIFSKVKSREAAERVIEVADAAKELPEESVLDVLDPEHARALAAEGDDEAIPEPRRALFYYARLVALAEASQTAVRADRSPDFHVRHLRTTFMKIVEFLRTGLFSVRLLGLTVQPTIGDPLAGHSAAVACISICMGRLLGLSRGGLADLGFSALYHDLGRAAVGRTPALDGPGEDPTTSEPHVLLSVAAGLRGKGYGDAGLLRIVVGQEHHRFTDGYPGGAGLRKPHVYSRIVGVADAFSNLEVGTPWAPAVSPAEALRRLQADPERYEPSLVQVLADVLGTIPRGTLLQLKDRSVAVVIDGGARRANRPVARQLLHSTGKPDERRTLVEIERPQDCTELSPYALDLDWPRALLG